MRGRRPVMTDKPIRGQVSFVNHEKEYILIEYDQSSKKKAVRGSISETLRKEGKAQNRIRKIHRYQIGDIVEFKLALSGRGDRMMAENIQYRFNPALDMLLNKAKKENLFSGYLKMVEDKYFVKETETYIFFPVPFSPWQIMPAERELNEPVKFSLEDFDNKEKTTASLLTKKFIPEYHSALKACKTKNPVKAAVVKISPHALHIQLFGGKIHAKIPLSENDLNNNGGQEWKTGDSMDVLITYLGAARIVVEQIV